MALVVFAAAGMAQAGYVTPTTVWTEAGEMELGTKAEEVGGYTIDVKDGNTVATVTKDVLSSSALYVREGQVTIGGTDTHHTVEFKTSAGTNALGYFDNSWSPLYLNVAGKNATVVIDNATVQNYKPENGYNLDTGIAVGGPDGNGTLIIRNGGKLLCGSQGYFQIGYQSHRQSNAKLVTNKVPVHATTIAPNASNVALDKDGKLVYDFDNRYEGEYEKRENGREFGHAVVTVTGEGSLLETSQYGLGLGDGELNILDSAVCNSNYYKHDSYGVGCVTSIGYATGCVSTVNVKNNAVWNINNQLQVGEGAGSKTVFNIEHATVNLNDEKGAFLGMGTPSKPEEYDYADQGSYTELNLLEGAKLNVSEELYVSYTASAKLTVAATAVINDQGGALDRLIVNEKGSIENKGKINMITEIRGGSVTLDAGCTMEEIMMSEGNIYVNGFVTAGSLELNGGTITFAFDALEAALASAEEGVSGALIDAESLTLGTNLKIVVKLDEAELANLDGKTFSLFDVANQDEAIEKLDIVFTDGSTTKIGTIAANGGAITVTNSQTIPEPATATLSLLALAALAARRRRH